ncbi:PD40 domain-containing protein [candidate division WOR-3 bacterium]|nr:PD40 domain-containing protein [candidate division WOR-3 bacterium]
MKYWLSLLLVILLTSCDLWNDTTGNGEVPDGWEPPLIRTTAGADWGPHNWIVFTYSDSGLFLIKPDGSDLRLIYECWFEEPKWHPDGKWIVANDLIGRIWLISADGDSVIQITQGGHKWCPTFSPDGSQIAFSTPDSDAVGPRGLRILDLQSGIERFVFPRCYDPAWSPHGNKLVSVGWVLQSNQWIGGIVVVDTSGENAHVVHQDDMGGGMESPSFSPDGLKIVFRKPYTWGAGVGQIWVVNADGSDPMKLTTRGGRWPSWSSDGSKIVYTRYSLSDPDQEGSGDLYIMNSDGSAKTRLTFFNQN